ncbi:hypothetical protein Dsin_005852 [Dipteronia sinensis]|uniref:Transposase n=1 Tax=Dipteronia sinensis TaxID=43782 RepID=A0AAE0AYB5_9ROSI|nr:hypothetical protein Dsin_005852 [Dipteronia sinensis]
MDPTHPYFPDGLNMLNDDFDLSGPAETVAGHSCSGATPTSRTKSKRLTSDVWQCFDVVEMTLPDETYDITYRILSITLDNASANTKFIALFTERNISQAGGYFFHQRCACHIINLVVQSGLKEVSNRIERIRDAISWIGSSNPRFQEFGRHCTLNGLRPRRFQTDMPVFYNATVTLSGVYYPTSSQAIHQIVEMSDMLNTYREDDLLGDAVVAMETKFKKYWSEMPFLYSLGVIVDPRIKLAGLEYLLEFTGLAAFTRNHHQNRTHNRCRQVGAFSNAWKKDKSASSSSSTTRSAASSGAELNRFLEAQFDADENTENFDLLLWWKTYSYRYPVLSHLARDILVIPVSTVSSEQAFSTSGRIIEPRRNCLTQEMVEENESGENSNILQRSMGTVTRLKSEFMLGEDRVIPQVCISLIERAAGDVIWNDIPAPENTQQFGSASDSNQVFTQRSATQCGENICVVQPVLVDHAVPPVVVDQAVVGEPQFDDVFGCQIEMNDGQYNEQYNEIYNEMYNEQNTEPNLGLNQKVDNEANIDPVDHVENTDEEPVQIQRRGRRVEGVSCSKADMPGTSEVRHNVSADDSNNTTT